MNQNDDDAPNIIYAEERLNRDQRCSRPVRLEALATKLARLAFMTEPFARLATFATRRGAIDNIRDRTLANTGGQIIAFGNINGGT